MDIASPLQDNSHHTRHIRPGLFTTLLDILFPPVCHICRATITEQGTLHICSACLSKLSAVSHPHCTVCGLPYSGSADDHPCGKCLQRRPHFDSARSAMILDGPLQSLIHSYKYRYKSHLHRPLAHLIINQLCGHISSIGCTVIMAVPLHPHRLRERGFNQSLLIARLISRHMNVPLTQHALRRIRRTIPQTGLTADERTSNVKGAFSVERNSDISGKNIILVDDVMTTGSTVNECATILKQSGAQSVHVITVARAVID